MTEHRGVKLSRWRWRCSCGRLFRLYAPAARWRMHAADEQIAADRNEAMYREVRARNGNWMPPWIKP